MPDDLHMNELHFQAADAIESGDPADKKRFLQASGMTPSMFVAMLDRQGLDKTAEAIQKHLDANVGVEGIQVRLKELPITASHSYSVEIANGHRAGEPLYHLDSRQPMEFLCDTSAQIWLERAGYTLVAGVLTHDTLPDSAPAGAQEQDAGHQRVTDAANKKMESLIWIGNADKAVGVDKKGLQMAIRFGKETITYGDIEMRLRDREMGDDLPIIMSDFGVDYDKACDAVFDQQFDKALDLLRRARPFAIDPRVERLAYVQEWSKPTLLNAISHIHSQGLEKELLAILENSATNINLSALRGGDTALKLEGVKALGFASTEDFDAKMAAEGHAAAFLTLNDFQEAKTFLSDPHAHTGDERDMGLRAFQYPGGLMVRLDMRNSICTIDLKQESWNGLDSTYELYAGVTPEDYEGYSSRLGDTPVQPGAIVCGPAENGKVTLATSYMPFETGRKALEGILFERVYLREHVPAAQAERALRTLYERDPYYNDPERGGGDFMRMVEELASDPLYAFHHLAKHLNHQNDLLFGIEEGGPAAAAAAAADKAKDDSPSPGM